MIYTLVMPAIKKPEHMKISAAKILVYVPTSLKSDADAMAVESGVSTSERVRKCLENEVRKWKASS